MRTDKTAAAVLGLGFDASLLTLGELLTSSILAGFKMSVFVGCHAENSTAAVF